MMNSLHPFNFNHHLIKLLLLFSCAFFTAASESATDSQTVLVTSKKSVITKLQTNDIRRIFLGLRPVNSTQITTPIINMSNPLTYKLFLKNIMFLTERGYKRKLIKRVFRQGADKIQSFNSIEKLTVHLRINPNNISYMHIEDVKNNPDLKVIQVLW